MFPDYLDGAKVLEYTDKGHFGFITDYNEDNTPVEKEICYLAVCRYVNDEAYYLFSCDRECAVIGDACFHTLEICKTCHPDSEGAVWHQKTAPCLLNAARRRALGGTCYFEFQRGRFRGKHWQERSVYLHADRFDELKLYDIFAEAMPDFDYCGVTSVTPAQYERLKALALAQGGETAALMEELEHWVQDCFYTENVFTICGI